MYKDFSRGHLTENNELAWKVFSVGANKKNEGQRVISNDCPRQQRIPSK